MAQWLNGSMALWLCGSVALWLCGSVALWLCGSVALWLCGSMALWRYGSVALQNRSYCSSDLLWHFVALDLALIASWDLLALTQALLHFGGSGSVALACIALLTIIWRLSKQIFALGLRLSSVSQLAPQHTSSSGISAWLFSF
ncbi:hypothetical protein CKK34_4150 [Yarrowia sp. E02]|nr:hypothetical protein CKK34_4150 [Yarrowia sp. E02]